MEEEKPKKKFSKLFLFVLISLFLVGSVFAAVLVVKSHQLTGIKVKEAFTVQYAVLTSTITDCATLTTGWTTTDSTTIGDLYPGEAKKVCVRINNTGRATLHYSLTSVYNDASCIAAFGPVLNKVGTLNSGAILNEGVIISISEDAPTFDTACTLTINAGRGQ